MPARAETVLISREAIAQRVDALGAEITNALGALVAHAGVGAPGSGSPREALALVPVLTGALVFTADLVRRIPLRLEIRPVTLSSYRDSATRPGELLVRSDIPSDLRGRHVLIVDDILDSGATLARLRDAIAAQAPASLRICVLLRKEKTRLHDVAADFVGFDIPDEFVVGYGLDYDGLERNRSEIIALNLAVRTGDA